MFDTNSVVEILSKFHIPSSLPHFSNPSSEDSLDWGTIEQYFLWELLLAHNITSKFFYGLIPYLDYKSKMFHWKTQLIFFLSQLDLKSIRKLSFGFPTFSDRRSNSCIYYEPRIKSVSRPNYELIKLLLNREVERGDQFTSTLLHFWSSETTSTTSKFVGILHSILSASLGNKDKKKNR